ncbi:hypothetical protein TraAM80_03646 [Trypanosoma rangeli]|uniref:Uncharacterized protein n=1 Tax=Trypanosoma rangeli TaxID=5698 RepID=A0A3S5IRH8_TRYRA|nr:uncharacterized protein TraAM80_03646 [Trypanosoma rangeli]RNF06813.1 hypothetical protein TraAM80_03646 [Trypanosoma rangeli]|eukprot:RNF06813.1 hypothetical protein TraAM80_03646 [Trypanosoma rangeli]
MYVGAWQEYKLMKVIESLREENERLRHDASGSPDGLTAATSPWWGVDAGQGSSHHFPVSIGDVPTGGAASVDNSVTLAHIVPTAAVPRSVPRRVPSNLKNTTLRLMTAVHGVGVFVEETEDAHVAPMSGPASVGFKSCSEGVENNKAPSLSNRRLCERVAQVQLSPKDCKSSVEDNPATVVHTEIGTGRILGASHQLTPPSTAMYAAAVLLPSLMDSPQARDNLLLKEVLRGAPLDTKTKYQQAGQPLPERHAPKKSKKSSGLTDEEVQQRIERRLRLQMLYTGNLSAAEHVSSGIGGPLKGHQGQGSVALPPLESEVQARQVVGFATGTGQAFPGVPWDFSAFGPPNASAEDDVTLVCTSAAPSAAIDKERGAFQRVFSSFSTHNRLRHPYDVGAPLSPPTVVATSSYTGAKSPLDLSGSGKTAEGGDGRGNSRLGGDAFRNSCGGDLLYDIRSGYSVHSALNPPGAQFDKADSNEEPHVSVSSAGSLHCTRVYGRTSLEADPIDDDAIGMLINWAEQLDPDSIA